MSLPDTLRLSIIQQYHAAITDFEIQRAKAKEEENKAKLALIQEYNACIRKALQWTSTESEGRA